MSVKHTIRKDGKGNTKTVRLTPLTAIRSFCLECLAWSSDEVEKCTAPLCPLFPFRSGKEPSTSLRKKRSPAQVLQLKQARLKLSPPASQ